MILVYSLMAMTMGLIFNLIIIENEELCNKQNMMAYDELVMAGSILMVFNWIIASQTNSFNNKWLNMVAIAYAGMYFFDVIEGLRLYRSNDQQVICLHMKKSMICISILYFLFSYLVT